MARIEYLYKRSMQHLSEIPSSARYIFTDTAAMRRVGTFRLFKICGLREQVQAMYDARRNPKNWYDRMTPHIAT